MDINTIFNNPSVALLFILLSIWSLAWKGVALWKAARNNQRNWFIVIMIINTFGILEIAYIFYFSKPQLPKHDEHVV